ncbi:MAG: hypothetical protein IJ736_14270, partial [Firmicutes bacterium]|nr:hypothetical protein [Bacillota bacterium]
MNKKIYGRINAFILAVIMIFTSISFEVFAEIPSSVGWTVSKFKENKFRVYKHVSADSAEAEQIKGNVIDLSDPIHFYIDVSQISYGGFAVMKLNSSTDVTVPTEGSTITDENFYEISCSNSQGIGLYLYGSGAETDISQEYADGTTQVTKGMPLLRYHAGIDAQNQNGYYISPGYYRFVYFRREDQSITYSNIYEITDKNGLFTAPGTMDIKITKAGGSEKFTVLPSDGTYDLTLSNFKTADGNTAEVNIRRIDFATAVYKNIPTAGTNLDSIVSYDFLMQESMWGNGESDERTLEQDGNKAILKNFTTTSGYYGNKLCDENNAAKYRVRVNAEVNGKDMAFYSTIPLTVVYHNGDAKMYDITYKANYPNGGKAEDISEIKTEFVNYGIRAGSIFKAPESYSFKGWNTEAD